LKVAKEDVDEEAKNNDYDYNYGDYFNNGAQFDENK